MAKYNLFLGTAKGSVGDVTLYRMYGQQVSRVRVREISNPKSEAQQIQRSIAATVTQAYSALKSICNHSFEDVQYRAKSMFFFNKRNMKLLRSLYANINTNSNTDACAITAPNVSTYIPNEYLIAKGSLDTMIKVTMDDENNKNTIKASLTSLTEDSTISDTYSTFGSFMEAIGLYEPKSVFTLIWTETQASGEPLYAASNYDENATPVNNVIWNTVVHINRLVRSTDLISDDDAAAEFSEASTLLQNYVLDDPSSDYNVAKSIINNIISNDNSTTTFDLTDILTNSANYATSVASIHSEYNSTDGWKRSTEYMDLTNNSEVKVYIGLKPYYALSAWTDETSSIGDSDYLLDGDTDGLNTTSVSTEDDTDQNSTDIGDSEPYDDDEEYDAD